MAREKDVLKDGYMSYDEARKWLDALSGDGMDVRVPVEKEDGKVGYDTMTDHGSDAVLFDFHNSHLPPKAVVFPQSEVLLRYRKGKDVENALEIEEVRPEMEDTVIFGIRPCDAMAVGVLDSTFAEPNADPYYWDRRNKVTLVGMGCTEPHYNCFCTTVGGDPHGTTGLDVLLTDVDGGFYAEALTERGKALLDRGSMGEATSDHRSKAEEVTERARADIARQTGDGPLDVEDVASSLEGMFDSPIWDGVSRKCVGCGACTFVCPTCHCFDINDEGEEAMGRRVRTWDSCQFPLFTLHSSSHNPRPVKKNRIRQRVLHKFKYMPENIEMFGCVGCGRCISVCPVNMDIFRILLDAREYEAPEEVTE